MAIFWWLAGFTAFEVAYSTVIKPPKVMLISGLVVLAAIKAVLVALYFMHLKFERKALGILFASTLILGRDPRLRRNGGAFPAETLRRDGKPKTGNGKRTGE